MISLNDLPDTPNNVLFQLFASKFKQKLSAFGRIEDVASPWDVPKLEDELSRLGNFLFPKEGAMAVQAGQKRGFDQINSLLADIYVRMNTKEELLSNFSNQELMDRIPTEEMLERIPAEKRLEGISEEDLLRHFEKIKKKRRVIGKGNSK